MQRRPHIQPCRHHSVAGCEWRHLATDQPTPNSLRAHSKSCAAQYNRGNAAAANSRDFRVSSRGPSLCEDHVNRGTSQSRMCFAAGKARSTAITARWTAAASETFHTTCQSLCEVNSCYRELPPLSAPSTKTSRTCCHDFSLLRAALSLLLASAAVPRCNRGSAVMNAAQQQRINAGDY